jgi:hypothetical protein
VFISFLPLLRAYVEFAQRPDAAPAINHCLLYEAGTGKRVPNDPGVGREDVAAQRCYRELLWAKQLLADAVSSRIAPLNPIQVRFILVLVLTSSCATQRDSELAGFPGHAGVYVRHLKTGEEAVFRADEIFNSASMIKLPVAALAFEKVSRSGF